MKRQSKKRVVKLRRPSYIQLTFDELSAPPVGPPLLRLIGDIHRNSDLYLQLVNSSPGPTFQVGDLSNYHYDFLDTVDATRNKIIMGNRDAYGLADAYPHFLGDYGAFSVTNVDTLAREVLFYVRGAYSTFREREIHCFDVEEIGEEHFANIQEAYKNTKPDWVVSHDCPQIIAWHQHHGERDVLETRTGLLLQSLYDIHRPRFWYFGHHHHEWSIMHETTGFACVPFHRYIDLPLFTNFEIIQC